MDRNVTKEDNGNNSVDVEWNEELEEYLNDETLDVHIEQGTHQSDPDSLIDFEHNELKDVNIVPTISQEEMICSSESNGSEEISEAATLHRDSMELSYPIQMSKKAISSMKKRSSSMDRTIFGDNKNDPKKCFIKSRSLDNLERLFLAEPKICGDSLDIQAFLHKARFFRIALNDNEMVKAKENNVCLITAYMESLLCEALNETTIVLLIFMLKNDSVFGGFAGLSNDLKKKRLNRDERDIRLRAVQLNWISQCSFQSDSVGKPTDPDETWYVDSSKYEFKTHVGQKICSMFTFDKTMDLSNLRNFQRKISSRKRTNDESSKKSLPSLLDLDLSYNQFKRPRNDFMQQGNFLKFEKISTQSDSKITANRKPFPLREASFPERFNGPRFGMNNNFRMGSFNSSHFPPPYRPRTRYGGNIESSFIYLKDGKKQKSQWKIKSRTSTE